MFVQPDVSFVVAIVSAMAVRASLSGLVSPGDSDATPGLPGNGNLNFNGTVPTFNETTASMIAAGSASCASIHMIVARASTELPGTGVIGSLALLVMAKQQGATIESVQYPALLAPYAPSSGAGTQATIKAITAMSQTCPDTKMVLMGYSQVKIFSAQQAQILKSVQGAHIILDAMCGGGATQEASLLSKLELAPPNAALSANIQSKVVAIVQVC